MKNPNLSTINYQQLTIFLFRNFLTILLSRFKLVKSYLPPLAWMIVIFIFSSTPNLELSGEFSCYDFFLRKLAHIAEYAILFLLWYRVDDNWKKALAISFAYAIFDEIHQYFVPTRDGKIVDVLIDGIGISLGLFVVARPWRAYFQFNWRAKRPQLH